jgi:PAS domain S-box-containing protein
MVGYTEEELRALTVLDLTHEDYREANFSLVTELVEGKRRQFQIEKKYRRKDGSLIWVSNNVSLVPGTEGVPRFLMALSEDITERKRAEALLTGEKRILEMVAKGDSLPKILDSVCRFVEEQANGFLASILLVDGNRLRHGGAPSLPTPYTDAIDGAVIGPAAGSCGTAAYRGEQVIVEDIATDPLWADYREAALPHSLRACWSTPVFSSQGKVMATFAMYYREPRSPSPRDQETIEQITHLVGVAIERQLTQEALRASEHNLSLIINTIPALAWSARPDGTADFFNQHYLDFVGLSAEQAQDWGWTVAVHPEDLSGLAGSWQSIMASAKAGEAEARLRRFDGEYRWFLFRANPLRDDSGNIIKWFGINTDIEHRKRAEEQLRRSERDLHEAQRLAHTGSWRYDVSSQKVTNSPEGNRIHGIQPNEDPSAPELYFSRIHPDDRERIRELFERCVIQKSEYQPDYAIVLPDGTIKHLHAIGHPILNESGELVEFVGTTMDVTEQMRARAALEKALQEIKQRNEALRRSEVYLAEAQRMTHTGSWAWNVRTEALFWSQEIFRIYDYDPEMTPTWDSLLKRVHPEDRLRIEQRKEMEFTQKEWTVSEIDFRIVVPDGTIKHLHSIAHPMMDESGEINEVVGTVVDVTERKRAEEALQRSEAYLADAQRLTQTGSWAFNAGGGGEYWSEENFRIWGFEPQRGAPDLETLLQRIHPEDRDRVRESRVKALQAKRDYDLQFRIVLPGGTTKHIQVSARPVFSATGDLIEVVGTHVDITERKRAEEERERWRQLEADLAHMNRVTMLGELTSSLAHEINQPIAAAITSANACLRWLERNPPDLERARAAAKRIENDGSRAAEIIQRLRAFYKTGAPPERELVDINEVAGEMLALLGNEATRHSISLRTELAPQLPQIMADRVQLQQVLMNLMLNGIEAMTDGEGELTIRSQSTEDGFLLTSVSDTGVGLPDEKPERIFNAFYTTKPQGTGMGLAISRSIIEAHGGHLWASANSERGATFHFSLPAERQQ